MSRLNFRDATPDDLAFIVRLIVDDNVTPTSDRPDEPAHPRYLAAFEAIAADPNQRLIIAEFEGQPVGTQQLSFIPGIARFGETRCMIEAVHIVPATGTSASRRDDRLGHRTGPRPRLRHRAAHLEQETARCPPLLWSGWASPRATKVSSWRFSARRTAAPRRSGRRARRHWAGRAARSRRRC